MLNFAIAYWRFGTRTDDAADRDFCVLWIKAGRDSLEQIHSTGKCAD